MPLVDIICLANSRKLRGRCIAGLRLDGSGWLRPVGKLPDGTLYPPDYTLDAGSEPITLDVIRLGIDKPRSTAHQPENWLIDNSSWTLIERPASLDSGTVLRKAIVHGPELLRGFSDRVPLETIQQTPMVASLALIAPPSIRFYSTTSYRGNPQARGQFSLGSGTNTRFYDLTITDPFWEGNTIQNGSQELRQIDGRFVITVSLGGPFALHCYKLIAAIIPLSPPLSRVL